MLEVDDSELTHDDRAFIKRWAEILGVREEVLLGRVLKSALDGDNYVEKKPQD